MASMSIIPQHIITTHILHHLPPKSVGRFQSVSKEWLSLLSEPRFIQRHQKTLNKNHIILGSPEFGSYWPSSISLQTKLRLELFDLDIHHGSVNGLVLGSNLNNLLEVYTLTVLNPTTGDYVELPFHKQVNDFGMLGFGYDSVTDDYKVVHITGTHDYYWNNVHVYRLRTDTWKQVTDLPYNHCDKRLSGVFVNGFLHWIVSRPFKQVIVAFSLADEKFSELPSPSLHYEIDIDTRLVALGEKLAMFHTKKGHIWLMNEFGVHKSWTNIVVHGFNEIPMVRTFDGLDEAPMARTNVFYKNGKVVFLTGGLLWIYDVEEQTLCKSVDISQSFL
ncbi:F-box associated domain containing protein [Tanacetum coccineum]